MSQRDVLHQGDGGDVASTESGIEFMEGVAWNSCAEKRPWNLKNEMHEFPRTSEVEAVVLIG